MAVTASPRLGLTRWSASSDPFRRAQLDADHAAIDNLAVIHAHGLFNARPAAGVRGRFYYATDVGGGTLYYDNGTAWSAGVVLANDPRLTDARTPLAHTHAAADVSSGVFTPARLGTGTASASTFLRGDGTWAAVGGGTLAALTDTTLASLAAGQFLRYDGSTWRNAALAIGDLPVAASGSSSATQVVRADDLRLSNARTPTAHSHSIGDLPTDTTAPAALGTATAGTANTVARRDHVHPMPTAAQVGAAPTSHTHDDRYYTEAEADARFQALGTTDTAVNKVRAADLETHTRGLTFTYNGDGSIATMVEKAGATTVKTTTFAYSGGIIATVTEVAAGTTVTTTLASTDGVLNSTSRSVA